MHVWHETIRLWLQASPVNGVALFVASATAMFVLALTAARPFRTRPRRQSWKPRVVAKTNEFDPSDMADPKAQMEVVARVEFEPQRLLNRGEYRLLLILEKVIRELDAGFRVMAQTSMGEIIRPKKGSASSYICYLAYRSINSKRIDLLVINRFGTPVLAVEYQGDGHYRSQSFMRDAVKREALRKARIQFLEVQSDYNTAELMERLYALLAQYRSS